MTIIQSPATYNFAGNIPDLIVDTTEQLSFTLSRGGTQIVAETYTPAQNDRIVINLRNLLELLVEVPGYEEVATPIAQYTYTLGSTTGTFYCLPGGHGAAVSAESFLRGNFLTWQPQTRVTLYHTPHCLRYAALAACVCKVKGYFTDGTSAVISLLTMSAGNIYTMDVSFGTIRGKFDTQPTYYDVWVENTTGQAMTWLQRYMLADFEAGTNDYFIFVNSLGGFDTIRFSGDRKEINKLESVNAIFDDQTLEYDIDRTRSWKKYTGYIADEQLRMWVLDFFNSPQRYHLTDSGALQRIYVSEPKLEDTAGETAGYEFTYAYSRQSRYINLERAETPQLLEITDPASEVFFLAPRLNQFEAADPASSADYLIPIQAAAADKWLAISLASLLDYIKPTGIDVDALQDYLTDHKYATQAWVSQQNFLTTAALDNYLLKSVWDEVFEITTENGVRVLNVKLDIVGLKGISAYGLGSTSGGSASGSLGELVNVGQWADAVPTVDRVMVQLAGATHWSAKPLADLVGLDTTALAQYLTANSYLKASDISSYLTWANLSGKPTVYPTSWELVVGRPTKLSDLTDDVVAGNYLPKPTWDAVFEVVTVDGTPALKVKYDILGLKGITAYADGSLSGGFSGALVDLVDVAVTNLASGDILKYNGTHFVNVPVSSIAGASSWDQITGKPEYYPTRWADVSGAPASLPASDVYPWAKAASKPTYTAAEVGAVALNGGGDVSGSINASAYLTANTLRAKAALYPTISFVKTNDNSESLLIVAGNNLYYRPVASDTTNRLVYHSGNFNPGNYLLLSGGTMTGDITFGSNGRSLRGSDGGNIAGVLYDTPNARYVTAIGTGSRRLILVSPASIYRGAGGVAENYMIYDSGNFNPSSKLDKSVWDEAFELKTVNGVRVISAKLDFLSVAGISAYATGPSSGGGGGGLDYDLLKQALTGAITPDGYPFTISASFLGAIDKTYLTGKLANTYADKVHTHLWADITDRPTSLPANGGNADTVDNLHASSFAQIKSYNFPSGGINNITDLDFTGNIQAHFPGAEYSCIWQGKDYQGTILQLKLRDYAGKQSMMYRGSLTKIWRTVWDSGNFNPDNKFGLSGIISDLNNAPLNAVFSTNGTPANAPLENAYFQGFTFAMDNNPDFKRQWAFKDKKIWFRNLHAGSWSAWTDVIPLDNYLPLSGGSITGGLGVSGYLTAGVLRVKATSYPQISFVNTTTNRDSLLFVNGSGLYWRPTAGTATDYQVYHSGNFNPDSKLGVSSVAVEAKKMSYQGLMTAISGTTTFPAGLYLYGVYNNGYPVTYGNLLRVGGSGLGEMLFGWAGDASVGGLYYRSKRDVAATAWSNWCKLWTSANSNLSTIDWSANNLNAAANLDVAGQAYVSGWLRSRGNVGWYSQDYGGGIHMTDSTWVRVYGSKGLMIDTGTSPISMGQLQITCSAEASIGFRSASNGNWCLGKGVKSIGSGFGLYNAVTNRAAFQIDSATDNASFVGSITAPTFVGNLSGSASSVNGYDINSFTGYYKYTIDASSLDQNTYYPVTMYLGNHNTVRISVIVALDSGTKPAWSSHASGYSVRFIEEVNGSGWGTSEVSRNILANEYKFANANPVGRVEQMTNSSTEVIWVRGGGKYFFYLSIPYITPALRTSTFTNASQSVSPRTDTMDLRMAANGNGIAVSKLYAHNSIEINGFTIDVYNGALRVNGNLVATGGVTAYQ